MLPIRREYNQGPTRSADSIISGNMGTVVTTGDIPSPHAAKEAPPARVKGIGHQMWLRLVTTFKHPYEFEPALGGRAMFPSPFPYVSDALGQQPQIPRLDWRRPNAVIPGEFLP